MMEDVPKFDDLNWVMDLAFPEDVRQEVNALNLKLRDPGQLIISADNRVKALSTKMTLWKKSLSQKKLSSRPDLL